MRCCGVLCGTVFTLLHLSAQAGNEGFVADASARPGRRPSRRHPGACLGPRAVSAPSPFADLRVRSHDEEWRYNIDSNSTNRGQQSAAYRVFLRRMRKAGSTTILNYLCKVVRYASEVKMAPLALETMEVLQTMI